MFYISTRKIYKEIFRALNFNRAAAKEHVPIVKLLLAHGANLEVPNSPKMLLHTVLKTGNTILSALLLDHGAPLNLSSLANVKLPSKSIAFLNKVIKLRFSIACNQKTNPPEQAIHYHKCIMNLETRLLKYVRNPRHAFLEFLDPATNRFTKLTHPERFLAITSQFCGCIRMRLVRLPYFAVDTAKPNQTLFPCDVVIVTRTTGQLKAMHTSNGFTVSEHGALDKKWPSNCTSPL